MHHLLSLGAEVNQRDGRGLTPLHRAAYLAHLDGYTELYEYLLSRWGSDGTVVEFAGQGGGVELLERGALWLCRNGLCTDSSAGRRAEGAPR